MALRFHRLSRSLSIIIPAYNEENRLPSTLLEITNYLAASEWRPTEILVVDDGSSDGTVQVARSYAENGCSVRVLRNPGNRGKGFSVRHGMREGAGDWLLFTDADLSTPIAELEKLWAAVQEGGAAVAIGSRALDRSLIGVRQPEFRERAGQIFNWVMRMVLRLPLHDTQCGFKLFRQDAARAVFERQKLDRFGFDAEALFLARKLGFAIREVPVRWNDVAGSKVSMLSGARGFVDLLRVRLNDLRGIYKL
jgi:dolichyl-phosphate beta-glucosyltransferase